jgi:hypothetical protein
MIFWADDRWVTPRKQGRNLGFYGSHLQFCPVAQFFLINALRLIASGERETCRRGYSARGARFAVAQAARSERSWPHNNHGEFGECRSNGVSGFICRQSRHSLRPRSRL